MLSIQILWNCLIAGSIYGLVTIGFALTYNIGNFFNMSHGAVFLVGAYTGYLTYRIFGWGLPIALVFSAISAGIVGLILQRFIFGKLFQRKASSLTLFIASLAILIISESLVAAFFGDEILVFHTGPATSFNILGGYITVLQLEILALSTSIFILMYLFFQKTNTGKMIRAVSDDRDLAIVIGIPVRSVLSNIFFYGSAIAGLAGTLVGFEQSIRPATGMKAILWAMIASIIGGSGSFVGPILGAFLLGVLENLAVATFYSEWKNSIVFLVMILFFLFRPTGIWGTKR